MEPIITASQHYQKEANRNLILTVLQNRSAVSRAELARITGLKRSTITHIVHELLESGLVYEGDVGAASPLGGRRPIALQIRSDFGYIIGIDIDRYTYSAALLDITGAVVDRFSAELKDDGREIAPQLQGIITTVYRYFSEDAPDSPRRIIAVGLGISGTVDPMKGLIMESRLHNMTQVALSDYLNDIPCPVLIENDANCSAWAEIVLAQSADPMVNGIYVFPRLSYNPQGELQRVEVGGAIIVNGAVWHGSRFITGEFSVRSWFSEGVEHVPFDRADLHGIDHDEGALRMLIREVCIKLVTVARMLDPDKIVLGGIFTEHFSLVTDVLRESLGGSWYTEGDHAARIIPAMFHEQSAAVGAGAYVLARLYQMPQVGDRVSPFDISWDYVLSSGRRLY